MELTKPEKYTILGVTDDITVCDKCGKKHLRDTVAMEDNETGEVLYFGSHCAAHAMGKPASRSGIIVREARALERVRPVIDAIASKYATGAEAASAVGKEAAKGLVIYGGGVSVTGYDSWGCVRVSWNGGRRFVSLAGGSVKSEPPTIPA